MSKLRADEFVNSDDNGAPSFPHSATVPAPTADDHFANKLYTDTSASTKSTTTTITNTISNTAPSNPSVGDFWTDTSESIIALGIWNGVSWVNVKNSLELPAGQIVAPPSISDPNGGYVPTMLTATSAVVSDATLSSSKWYKDDVELPGSEGSLQFYATELGTYKYEEVWVDVFGNQLFPSLSAVIDAYAGVINSQPTITSSNGVYSPTTLTATPAVVSNATLTGSRWYKDGVVISGSSGLSINIPENEGGIYKYEETWTDAFGTQLLPTLSASVQVFLTIGEPEVTGPTYNAGTPDFDFTGQSSAITSVDQVVSNVPVVGLDENFNGGTLYAQRLHSVYDPSTQRIVIAYTDWANNEYGTYVVGQVDGDSITFGTPATFRNSKCINIKTGYDPVNEKVYIAFVDGSNGSRVAVVAGDVDPTTNSINFGSYISLHGRGGGILGMAYDTTNQNMVVAYHDDTVHRGKIECVTMRDAASNLLGNGPQTEFGFGIYDNISNNGGISSNIVYDPDTNRIVIAYSGMDDYDGKVVVGEGTGGSWDTATVNFGSPVRFDNQGIYSGVTNGSSSRIRIVYNPDAQKIIIGYRFNHSFDNQASSTSNAQVIAGTVDPSTNTVNFGNSTVFGDLDPRELEIGYDSNYQKMILVYHPYIGGETNRLDFVTATIDGTTINVEDPVNIGTYSAIPYNTSIAYDSSNQKFVVSHTTNATGGISNVVSLASTATQLTLTDTTVSKVSDGTTIGGITIDEVLTLGEGVTSDIATSSTATVPVFSTDLWDGNNGTQTINTGIDLSNGSGMVWIKNRTSAWEPMIFDTDLGPERYSITSGTQTYNRSSNSGTGDNDTLSSFNSDGFDIGPMAAVNQTGEDYVSWAFRKAPGFFDVVTYTGNGGTAGNEQQISHNLGSKPGMIIVKRTDDSGDWFVFTDLIDGSYDYAHLNKTNGFNNSSNNVFTDSVFSVGGQINFDGGTYVAYVFAGDTPGLIKCGSYSSSGETVNLGFRPQWVMIKSVDNNAEYTGGWRVLDTARGIVNGDGDIQTWVNDNRVENASSFAQVMSLNDNGFTVESQGAYGSSTIYVAIAENAEADVTSDIYASGTISASSGNTITLSDVYGTWSTGMKVEGMTLDTRDYEDAVDPTSLSLTSSEPVVTQGLLTTWGNAQWQIAEDSGFTTNVQSYTSQLTASGNQVGPSEFNLDYEKDYFVRTKYGSSNPSNVFSDWSDPIPFRTSVNITYSVSHSTTSVDEGSSVTFDVTTTGLDDGTVLYYSLTGGSADGADIDGGLTGSLTINSNFGSATIAVTADQTTEGSEDFVFRLRTDSTSGEIVYTSPTININDTSIEPAYLNTYLFKSPRDFKSSGSHWTVPTGVTHIWVSTVGAGGVGENYPNSYSGGNGGAGGYSRGVIAVTAGESLIVAVGSHNNNGYGPDSYAPGGGFSGILRGPSSPSPNPSYTSVIIAGAGGGGQVNTNYSSSQSTGHAGSGGGNAGQHASDNWAAGAYPAKGGTQSSGGNMSYRVNPWGPSTFNPTGPQNGSYLQGGTGWGGGGGGGYYGGGGDALNYHGGGAGGSGYIGGTLPFPSGGTYQPIRGTHQGSRRYVDSRMTNSTDYPLLGPNPISPQPWGHGGLGSNGPYPGRYSLGRGNGFVIIHCFKRTPGLSDWPTSFTVAGTY